MNRSWFVLFLSLPLLAVAHARAQAPAKGGQTAGKDGQAAGKSGQTAGKGYDAYVLVKTRNIFDPTRRPVRIDVPGESRVSSNNRNKPSYFALTGTMVAEGRSLAFFSGSRAEFSKVLPVGESVAGYKVIAITPLQAELEHDGKPFVMAVGHRLQLEGSSDESTGPEILAPEPSPSSSGPIAPAAAGPAVSADKAEILRRMMERRQKETSQ